MYIYVFMYVCMYVSILFSIYDPFQVKVMHHTPRMSYQWKWPLVK